MDSCLGQPRAAELTGDHFPHPTPRRRGGRERRCVTPRQACPRPEGFGRNLRSKTRWFTGFCNSHQVSHFATFFIDARAEISVAESRYGYRKEKTLPLHTPFRGWRGRSRSLICIPWRIPRRGLFTRPARGAWHPTGPCVGGTRPLPRWINSFAGRAAGQVSTMILPQVHLRKPCYDFSFL